GPLPAAPGRLIPGRTDCESQGAVSGAVRGRLGTQLLRRHSGTAASASGELERQGSGKLGRTGNLVSRGAGGSDVPAASKEPVEGGESFRARRVSEGETQPSLTRRALKSSQRVPSSPHFSR